MLNFAFAPSEKEWVNVIVIVSVFKVKQDSHPATKDWYRVAKNCTFYDFMTNVKTHRVQPIEGEVG